MTINVFNCLSYKKNNLNSEIIFICYILNRTIKSIWKESDEDVFFLFLKEIVVFSKNKKIVFFVNNLNLNGILILDSVFKNNLKFKWIVRDFDIYSITIFYLDFKIEFKCSYKFIPISLNSLKFYEEIKFFSYNKDSEESRLKFNDLKKNINFYDIYNEKKNSVLICKNETKVIFNLIKNLTKVLNKNYLNLFEKSFSASSLSYKIYFRFWNKYNIKKNLLKEEDAYIRKSYHGGRCEVFGNPLEDEKIYYYDFKGMYGQCMTERFPTGNGVFEKENLNFNKIGFHCIKFKSNLKIPVLPYKSKEKKLIFPNGVIVGCFWYEEIKLFVEKGGEVLEIYSSYVFKEEGFVFKDFVEHFFLLRQKKGFYKVFSKLIINSLYGGFGMSEKNYETFICFSDEEADKIKREMDVLEHLNKNKCHMFKIIKNKKSNSLFKNKNIEKSNNFSIRNVTYASIVTSKARIKLYKFMESIEKDNGRVLYCDTDCVVASYKKNNTNRKLEESFWDEIWKDAVFIHPKIFCYLDNSGKEVIKIKGLSEEENSFNKIKYYFYREDSCKKNENSNNFNNGFIEKIIKLNEFDKRLFVDNRKNTIPIENPLYNE